MHLAVVHCSCGRRTTAALLIQEHRAQQKPQSSSAADVVGEDNRDTLISSEIVIYLLTKVSCVFISHHIELIKTSKTFFLFLWHSLLSVVSTGSCLNHTNLLLSICFELIVVSIVIDEVLLSALWQGWGIQQNSVLTMRHALCECQQQLQGSRVQRMQVMCKERDITSNTSTTKEHCLQRQWSREVD